jgi:hypothetical protein
MDDRGSGVRYVAGAGNFPLLHRVQTGFGAPSLLSNGYRGLFQRGHNGRVVKLTTHLFLAPRSGMRDTMPPLPLCAIMVSRNKFTFPFTASELALGPTQPSIQRVPGTPSPGVKRPGRENSHLSPASAQIKNAWSYISTPPYAFITLCLITKEIRLHGMVISLTSDLKE